MSIISLADIKEALRITADDQDDLIQRLLDAAEDEAARFMNRTQLATLPVDYPESEDVSEDVPQDTDPLAPSVVTAVYFLVQSKFEMATPDEITKLRLCAEILLQPYRTGLGV